MRSLYSRPVACSTGLKILALSLALLVMAGCDDSTRTAVSTVQSTTMLTVPRMLKSSKIAVEDYELAVMVNGDSWPVSQQGNVWFSTFEVDKGNSFSVNILWSALDIDLAKFERTYESVQTNLELKLSNSDYERIDSDGDGRDNFTELDQGTNPLLHDMAPPDDTIPVVNEGSGIRIVNTSMRATEGDIGTTIDIERIGSTVNAIEIAYTANDVSANQIADYIIVNGVLRWEIGESGVKSIPFYVVADRIAEGEEIFQVKLSNNLNPNDVSVFGDETTIVTVVISADNGNAAGDTSMISGFYDATDNSVTDNSSVYLNLSPDGFYYVLHYLGDSLEDDDGLGCFISEGPYRVTAEGNDNYKFEVSSLFQNSDPYKLVVSSYGSGSQLLVFSSVDGVFGVPKYWDRYGAFNVINFTEC